METTGQLHDGYLPEFTIKGQIAKCFGDIGSVMEVKTQAHGNRHGNNHYGGRNSNKPAWQH
jgi:hypothetical protein